MNQQNIKDLIIENFEKYKNPSFVKYTKEWSMSPLDPSYIYSKTVGGVRIPKLVDRRPKFSKSCDGFLEYGFDSDGKCLYRKNICKDFARFNEFYFYENNIIYRVSTETISTGFDEKITLNAFICRNDFEYFIFEEYHFDEINRPKKIICHYFGSERNEEYHWLNDDVATVKERDCSYLLIKDGKANVLCVGKMIKSNSDNYVMSCQTQGNICLENYEIGYSNKLEHSSLDIQYSVINDTEGKATEFYELKISGNKYIVFLNYLKPPKGFSYKKAKEVYKTELMNAIEEHISLLDFKVNSIGIQYGNYGYSIMEQCIGFDDNNNEDIQRMKRVYSHCVSYKNREIIETMEDYIRAQGYYNSFHKLMLLIKNEIEEMYQVRVVLNEIGD